MSSAATAAPCRLALVLALDVSASVDAQEFDLQTQGVARALDAPDVRRLILQDASAHVSLAVFEWSATQHRINILPWTDLDSDAALDRAIATITAHKRTRPGSRTGIGAALGYAAELLRDRPGCWSHKIDVSGDGKNNVGPPPSFVKTSPELARATINGLVVLARNGTDPREATGGSYIRGFDLREYFETQVIKGPDAFTIVAKGYEDFARAMREKLLRELEVPAIGALRSEGDVPG